MPGWARRTRRWYAAPAFALAELVLRDRRCPLCPGLGTRRTGVAAAFAVAELLPAAPPRFRARTPPASGRPVPQQRKGG